MDTVSWGAPAAGAEERGATLLRVGLPRRQQEPLGAACPGRAPSWLGVCLQLLAHLSTLTARRLLPALFRNRCWASWGWGAGECGALGRSGCWGHPQCFGTLKTDCVLACDLLQGPCLGGALGSSFWGIPIPCWGAGSGSGNGAGELLPGDTSLCPAVLEGKCWVLWVREGEERGHEVGAAKGTGVSHLAGGWSWGLFLLCWVALTLLPSRLVLVPSPSRAFEAVPSGQGLQVPVGHRGWVWVVLAERGCARPHPEHGVSRQDRDRGWRRPPAPLSAHVRLPVPGR